MVEVPYRLSIDKNQPDDPKSVQKPSKIAYIYRVTKFYMTLFINNYCFGSYLYIYFVYKSLYFGIVFHIVKYYFC